MLQPMGLQTVGPNGATEQQLCQAPRTEEQKYRGTAGSKFRLASVICTAHSTVFGSPCKGVFKHACRLERARLKKEC